MQSIYKNKIKKTWSNTTNYNLKVFSHFIVCVQLISRSSVIVSLFALQSTQRACQVRTTTEKKKIFLKKKIYIISIELLLITWVWCYNFQYNQHSEKSFLITIVSVISQLWNWLFMFMTKQNLPGPIHTRTTFPGFLYSVAPSLETDQNWPWPIIVCAHLADWQKWSFCLQHVTLCTFIYYH